MKLKLLRTSNDLQVTRQNLAFDKYFNGCYASKKLRLTI